MEISVAVLKKMKACGSGVKKFESMFGKERVEVGKAILAYYKNDGWCDCRWFIPRILNKKNCIKWACYCVKQVLPIFEEKHPSDKRPICAINAALKCVKSDTQENRDAAYAAADAARAAYAARDVTHKTCADLVRKRIPYNVIKDAWT